jgi:hydrogenase maturation factor
VTCSDEAVPLRVIEVQADGTAVCEGPVEVMTELVDVVRPGDVLLVHAGTALQRAKPPEAASR